ncbi:MAG: N-acetylmuramoyl-L-alanine amidase [Clostridium sp.]
MKIFLDPGHGGHDNGAVNKYLNEKNINLIVATKVNDILTKKGFQVKPSRINDTFISLDDRCNSANSWGANLFISIHHNAGGGVGCEVIHSIVNGKGRNLAKCIADEFVKLGQKLRKIYCKKDPSTGKDYYLVIRKTKMPSIITEYAFIDSDDYLNINSNDKLYKEANAIALGICNFLKVT